MDFIHIIPWRLPVIKEGSLEIHNSFNLLLNMNWIVATPEMPDAFISTGAMMINLRFMWGFSGGRTSK